MGNGVLTTLHSNYKEQVSVGVIDDWIQEIEQQKTNDKTAPQKMLKAMQLHHRKKMLKAS